MSRWCGHKNEKTRPKPQTFWIRKAGEIFSAWPGGFAGPVGWRTMGLLGELREFLRNSVKHGGYRSNAIQHAIELFLGGKPRIRVRCVARGIVGCSGAHVHRGVPPKQNGAQGAPRGIQQSSQLTDHLARPARKSGNCSLATSEATTARTAAPGSLGTRWSRPLAGAPGTSPGLLFRTRRRHP